MNKKIIFITLSVFVALTVLVPAIFKTLPRALAATTRVNLLTADNFAVLAGSAISNTPVSVISGNVGLSPLGGASITGLTCGEVTGTIYDTNGGYTGGGGGSTACRITDAGLLTAAKNDLTTASNDAAGRTTTATIATELGGALLTDGVYDSAAGTFGITGTLTLDGQGNADSVFIFKMASTLITASSSKVVLTGSAQACNVYWLVGSSATLGTSTTLIGNVLAAESITDNGSSTVNGRLLASGAAVTLNKTTVTKQTCAAGTAGGPAATTTTTTTSVPANPPQASLHVVKRVINHNGSKADSALFKIHVKVLGIDVAGSPASGLESPGTPFTLNPSTYNVSEDAYSGYTSSISGDCDANGGISLASGDNKTCTITNEDKGAVLGASVAPKLPNTGFAPKKPGFPWQLLAVLLTIPALFGIYLKRGFGTRQ